MREFWKWKGVDFIGPMDKMPRRTAFAKEVVEHEARHRDVEQFLRERKQ
jgi:hypothetical protein